MSDAAKPTSDPAEPRYLNLPIIRGGASLLKLGMGHGVEELHPVQGLNCHLGNLTNVVPNVAADCIIYFDQGLQHRHSHCLLELVCVQKGGCLARDPTTQGLPAIVDFHPGMQRSHR